MVLIGRESTVRHLQIPTKQLIWCQRQLVSYVSREQFDMEKKYFAEFSAKIFNFG